MKNHFLPKNVHAKFNTFTAYTNSIYTRAKSKAILYRFVIDYWIHHGYLYVSGVQRRTIYEYHRVEVDFTRIQSNSVVILEPLTSMSDGKIGFYLCGFYTYFLNNLKNFKSSYEKFYIQLQFVSNYDARSLDENTSHDCSLFIAL